MATRTLHMGVHRRYIIHLILEEDDWRDRIFPDGFDGSREDAIQAIMDDGREVFCSCDCAKDERGACLGKPGGVR